MERIRRSVIISTRARDAWLAEQERHGASLSTIIDALGIAIAERRWHVPDDIGDAARIADIEGRKRT